MKWLKYISAILIFCCSITVNAQFDSEQDRYINSDQGKEEFQKNNWDKLRKTMIKESRGGSQGTGTPSSNESSDYNLQPGDYTMEDREEGSFYDYEEEDYNGEYSEYQYDDEYYEYYEEGSGGGRNGESGDGYGSGGGNDGFGGYNRKDREIDYGDSKDRPRSEDYNYNKQRDRTSRSPDVSTGTGAGMGLLQWFLIILLAIGLGVLLYYLFMNVSMDDKGQKVVTELDDLEPTEIPKSELEIMLEKALANKDYRAAVRIYFIFIIKDLSEKDWITWEKRKTNISYLMEMRSRKQYNSFNEVVSIFEIVWYGNYKVALKDYQQIEPKFKNLINSLNSEK